MDEELPRVIPSLEILGLATKAETVIAYSDYDDEELMEQKERVKEEIVQLGEMLKKREE